MNNKALCSTAVAAVLVGGCCMLPKAGGTEPRMTAAVCKVKECRITVQVKACAILVDPEVLGVARGNQNVEIVWEIRDSPGVTFAKEAPIFFKAEDREAAARQFRDPKPLSDTRYRWLNANTSPGIYHYGVSVVDNGKACPPLDPIIIDEM